MNVKFPNMFTDKLNK